MHHSRGANLQAVKWQNRSVALETLWQHQPISRKDLAERTHLTAATVTNIIGEFVAAGIVHEIVPGEPGRGRRPTLLAFVDDTACLMGVNLSRTELSIAVFDLVLNCHYHVTHPITTRTSGGAAETLIDLIRDALSASRIDPRRLVGIGVSSPGPLSVNEGVIYAPPQFAEWSNLPLGKLLTQAFKLPVWLENDANANALAEHWLGAGQPYNNFIYVESHSGVGSGIILGGRLFTGSAGVAAEIGHTSIDRNGPRCPCGNYGCVELYSSGPAVVQMVRAAHSTGSPTGLTAVAGAALEHLTFDQVLEAALAGDDLAQRVIESAACSLALGIVNAINLIDPQAVIIGHKLNRVGELALAPMREVIQQQTIPQAAARLNVLAGSLEGPVGVTGAACRALSGIFQEPNLLLRSFSLAG